MIFVDTSAWFALFVPSDPDHQDASLLFQNVVGSICTTDYVVDELLTLLKARNQTNNLESIGEALLGEKTASLEWIGQQDVNDAWDIMKKFKDKDWSFTDCTSMVVMQRLGIPTAFAFDEHFRQFGTVTVVP